MRREATTVCGHGEAQGIANDVMEALQRAERSTREKEVELQVSCLPLLDRQRLRRELPRAFTGLNGQPPSRGLSIAASIHFHHFGARHSCDIRHSSSATCASTLGHFCTSWVTAIQVKTDRFSNMPTAAAVKPEASLLNPGEGGLADSSSTFCSEEHYALATSG